MWKEFNDIKDKVVVKVDNINCAIYENLLFCNTIKNF